MNIIMPGVPTTDFISGNREHGELGAVIINWLGSITRTTIKILILVNLLLIFQKILEAFGLIRLLERDTEDAIEQMGIARTWAAVEKADMALLLVDTAHGLGAYEAATQARLPAIPRVTIHNKIDVSGEAARVVGDEVWISAKTGAGLDLLQQKLLARAGWQAAGEGAFMARARHLQALEQAAAHIAQARSTSTQLEFFAEELRLAQAALSEITGEFSADDLLGEIFSRFCIGK